MKFAETPRAVLQMMGQADVHLTRTANSNVLPSKIHDAFAAEQQAPT